MPSTRPFVPVAGLLLPLFLAACGAAPSEVRLREVVLYQNGVGYFERSGVVAAEGLRLRVRAHELDDVLTTLTVVDRSADRSAAVVPSAAVPPADASGDEVRELSVSMGGGSHDVTVAYAAQTSAWRPSYRLVLPDEGDEGDALLQAWAVVDNTTAEDWDDVQLTLATAAPLSFAVDLRTPRVVERPNLTGHEAPPVATGPVFAERTDGVDDGDGIPDEDDLCPDVAEDLDGFEDADGCPEPDNDADRVLDVDDLCPDDPETFNGLEDEDGCPDRGTVIVHDSALTILEQIYFAADSAEISPASQPILDAIAETLRGNPDIRRVEVEGHADAGEERPWAISTERAEAVRGALVAAGADPDVLVVRPFGATRPVDSRMTTVARERNRRATFRIAEQGAGDSPAPAPTGVRREALARTFGGSSMPRQGTGGTRYVVSRRVSIPAGQSAMVAMLSQRVSGEDVLLFRVDPNVPGSRVHPFRAARVAQGHRVDLVPGPISLFARGEFVGEGLIEGLHPGEKLFVPYALDDGSRVSRDEEEEEVPARMLSLEHGRLEVERTRIRRTTYEIHPGARAPSRIFIRHPRGEGYSAHDPPPGTESSESALLLPVPIRPRRRGVLVVDERRTVPGTIDLVSDLRTDVRAYLAPGRLAPEAEQRLTSLLDDRRALADLGEQLRLYHVRLGENAQRIVELRRSVASLAEATGGAQAVRRRIARQLEQAVADGETLAGELAALRAREAEARANLRAMAREFAIAPPER